VLILAIESSAKAASVALSLDGTLFAQYFQNNGQTHSRSVMPMVRDMLKTAGRDVSDLDAIAVAVGPGSFTGLRIGVAAAKGLAWGLDLPCIPVSTLEAMASQLIGTEGLICCAMDARRGQVYNALFAAKEGILTRLTPDRAISLDDLTPEIRALDTPVTVVGDGAGLCLDHLLHENIAAELAPPHLVMQSAAGVLLTGKHMLERGETVSAEDLAPNYLRLSQAERERLEREQQYQ